MPFHSVSRNPCKPYTPPKDPLADKRLYLDLVKGVFLGKMQTFGPRITPPVKLPLGENTPEGELSDLVEAIIGEYGYVLEEAQENELRELAGRRDIRGLTVRLKEVEALRAACQQEMVAEQIQKVETLLQEAAVRSQTHPATDAEIIRLREQLDAGGDIAQTLRAITRQYNDALYCLGAAVYRSVVAEVTRNGGTETDADDVWSVVLVEFITKIEKATYHWYDHNCLTKTFVVRIAKVRWLDELRRRKRRSEIRLTDYDNPQY